MGWEGVCVRLKETDADNYNDGEKEQLQKQWRQRCWAEARQHYSRSSEDIVGVGKGDEEEVKGK